jgi:hypothetical protein
MFLPALVRALLALAAVYLITAVLLATVGAGTAAPVFGFAAGGAILAALTIQIVINKKENTHGRYRKAPEAHRAGTGRGAGDRASTSARRGARGTGAGMSNPFIRGGRGAGRSNLDQLVAHMLATGGPIHIPHAQAPSPVEAPKERPAGEFDGNRADFAPGVVTGTRSFDVDKLGRLRGVAYNSVWLPGENTAECLARNEFALVMYGDGEYDARPSKKPPHAMTECGHGFYGYYEGSNDYYRSDRVMGVVEAYGETIIGTRGFRASKARIVALHIPAEISTGTRRLITRNYSPIPTFDSFDAMVAEFPPDDAGHGISPDTDPDFWTRKA